MTFPDRESLPYDVFAPHPDIVSQRLATLYQLPSLTRGVVVVPISALLTRLPPCAFVTAHSFLLDVGAALNLEAMRTRLTDAGYRAVAQVVEPGEFAVRGGLVDLFPIGSAAPYRIELYGDTVDSLRVFDPDTQRSGKTVESIRLLPAREYPLTETAVQQFRQRFRARFEGDPQRAPLYRDVSKGLASAGAEYFLPLFFDTTATLFDYLPATALCIVDEGVDRAAQAFLVEVRERYEQLRHNRERPLLAPEDVFLHHAEFDSGIKARARIDLSLDEPLPSEARAVTFATRPPPSLPVDHHAPHPYRALLDHLGERHGRVLLVAETAGRRETLRAVLSEHGLSVRDAASWSEWIRAPASDVCLTVGTLEHGLRLDEPAAIVIAEAQLYGERAQQRRRREPRSARDPEAIIKSLAELRIGDPVVHEDHGVGRYLGLQRIDVGDGPAEFLTLEYAGGDKLYIPVLSLHLIGRYTGTDPDHAPLHKLGGDAWDKAKARARQKAHDAAVELLEINALRAARRGHSFPPPDEHYLGFIESFPFEETPDQTRAIDEVVRDMTSDKPMDRLVCGDVGFGKTEVAMRAAFLAVHGRKQVAVLVPTTLLAQQHFQNFSDRFGATKHRIELLSRFRSATEQQHALAGLADGSVDIVIGTHRLLQNDVRFANLGLIILDEEHRFGVRHKERLKRLRAEVDILTLTATPIPRTLNMALAGLRDISMITTAPEGRLSVQTLVSAWNRGLIREACLREIQRSGQVYYLHNEVRTIERAARELTELLPEAEIRVAHGQMSERDLERVMLDFYHRRCNVLVCSTIIESGIDVPSANTIVIERADKLGLAQLHQLRGRVGRSHHRAYAYLLIPGGDLITNNAKKRLEAIESLEELGAGFSLAAHDLEIRGAGELLGESQSGEIDEIGFTLYSDLLNRAVQSLTRGVADEPRTMTEINLHAPALLPEEYVADVHQRLMLYKRIASAPDADALRELHEEIIDRFGLPPEPAQLLFQATTLKLRATPLGVRRIDAGGKGARIEFIEKPAIDPEAILRLLQSAPRQYRLDGPKGLRLIEYLPDGRARVRALAKLMDALDGDYETRSRASPAATRS